MIRRAAAYAQNDWELVVAFGGVATSVGMLVNLALDMLSMLP